jgi:hypothetical protein
MSLAKYPWWIVAQGMLLGGIALNMLTLQEYRLGMALALVCFALTFLSHDFRGRRDADCTACDDPNASDEAPRTSEVCLADDTPSSTLASISSSLN